MALLGHNELSIDCCTHWIKVVWNPDALMAAAGFQVDKHSEFIVYFICLQVLISISYVYRTVLDHQQVVPTRNWPWKLISLIATLQWRHNGCNSVSNHQPQDCLLNRLFRRRSKKTSKLHVTGLCAGKTTGIAEFPAQMASNAENVSIWWCHHEGAWGPTGANRTPVGLMLAPWTLLSGNSFQST